MANKQDKLCPPAEEILKEHIILKTKEILKVLNISRSTFDKLRLTKGFPKVYAKIGRRNFWLKEEIIKWLVNSCK